ncbi:MAG: 1-deoxy-D-xylulose-5-phosphate synthase [Gammaproteobacteria bacterium]|nr:1-deoxy-D-xylulose-5-phosphate synthase [Gammaproteobacteria bacterium]
MSSILDTIDTPEQIRKLPQNDLRSLADAVREYLIQSVSKTGGHLSSSLGTVELTVALHYVFNTPDDPLVWDVGHQGYPHKILTGRKDRMSSIRQKDGLSGFLKRSESPYDTFGAGHSSTSISAALGMALAAQQEGSDRKAVAIIGDGAMTAGMAFEALNHAGDVDANLLVILNDNDMSISPNVGGMSNYLARILSGRLYSSVREGSKKVLGVMPTMWELARRAEEHVKGMVIPGTLFEELGFNYIGPIDGHDLDTLVTTLTNLRSLKGPRFLHVVTKKGKGYAPAEKNPCDYHGITPFDPETGETTAAISANKSAKASNNSSNNTTSKEFTYTQVFGQWICDMAAIDKRLIGITPAMCEGSGLVEFSKLYPKQYIDVGIAEQHCVTLAAGLACGNAKPVVAVYSTFLQRAYDQLIHDVAIQNLPVLFAIDRAGIVGPDGATHAGSFDFSFLRCIPNMVVMAPADENECRQMLYSGFIHDAPCSVRYPRGKGPGARIEKTMTKLPIGKGEIRREGIETAILAFGSMVASALKAGDNLNASVVNMRFVKPIDQKLIMQMASNHNLIVTIEENAVAGGAGSAVNEYLMANGIEIPVINLGLPDEFSNHGSREQILTDYNLSSDGIISTIERFYENQTCQYRPVQVNS